ncbi:putative odorant receptor [Anopheles darlingi]|uniref:Putative odorant receptor n=1 Tax=Anopheles darlingi TaxID=43151 RepID=W5JUM6_ANODA|nr:putative odorant receptor [Anopheles darlingi]
MVLPKLQDPYSVMPLLLRLQRFVGLWGDRQYRYKFRLAFASFCILVVIPKLAFGYPDLDTTIRGTAELIFEWNVLFGMLLFSFELDVYDEMVNLFTELAKLVFSDQVRPELGNYLMYINRRIDKFSKIYCCSHFCLATFYWVAPLSSTYSAYLSAHNESIPVEHVLHLEEELYWLKNRVSLTDYSIFTVIMLPTIFMLAFFGGLKLLTIFSNVKYCSAMLRLVAMRIQLMDQLEENRVERELLEIITMHQKALSLSVARAVTDSLWYRRSVSVQRKLRMVLQRAQKPLGISAGKFCFVDVEQFGNMAKMSYSFYIVLKDQF